MNLIICGEIEQDPFAVEITDPSKTTVSDLKTLVFNTTSITKEELILYFNDDILPDDTPLSDWKGLRGGAAVMAAIKPLKVTLQRYSSPVEVVFTIPKLTVKKWSTKMFFDCCLHKGGLPKLKNGRYVFAVRGNVIKEEGKMMSKYECFRNDLTISVTFIHAVNNVGNGLGHYYVPVPMNSFVAATFDYRLRSVPTNELFWGENINKDKEKSVPNVKWNSYSVSFHWTLSVKRLDGTVSTVEARSWYFTPVYKLRQQISPDSIIRLTFGSTILEDWDEEGNMMLLCSYPDLHDGATLYQINLTGGIRVKYIILNVNRKPAMMHNKKRIWVHDEAKLPEQITTNRPEYIIIEDPHNFTLKRLTSIIRNIGSPNELVLYEWKEELEGQGSVGKRIQGKPDDVISSIGSIQDGCTLVTINPDIVKSDPSDCDTSLWF